MSCWNDEEKQGMKGFLLHDYTTNSKSLLSLIEMTFSQSVAPLCCFTWVFSSLLILEFIVTKEIIL